MFVGFFYVFLCTVLDFVNFDNFFFKTDWFSTPLFRAKQQPPNDAFNIDHIKLNCAIQTLNAVKTIPIKQTR